MRALTYVTIAIGLLLTGCQESNNRGPRTEVSPKLAKTIIEIRSVVMPIDPKENEAPQVYATTEERDLLRMTKFFDERRGGWQRLDGGFHKPYVQIAVTYGDGRQMTYGVEGQKLITSSQMLQLSEQEYQTVKGICFRPDVRF